MILVTDTICNTLPYYLKAEMEQVIPESRQMIFGQYDLFPTDSTRLFFHFDEATAFPMQLLPGGTIGVPLPFSPWVNSLFFLLFLFSFIVFAFIFRKEGAALRGNFTGLFSPATPVGPIHKSQVTKMEVWGEFYLLHQTLLIISIILFSRLWSDGLSLFSTTVQSLCFVVIFLALVLLVYLKIMGYRLIGTFFLQNEMKNWSIYYSRIMEILGIVFFLPAVFYIYLHEVRNIMLILLVILFFISRVVIYMKLLNIFVKNKISPFYFFVYLCGTEIAPYLLLYKGVLFALTIAGDNII